MKKIFPALKSEKQQEYYKKRILNLMEQLKLEKKGIKQQIFFSQKVILAFSKIYKKFAISKECFLNFYIAQLPQVLMGDEMIIKQIMSILSFVLFQERNDEIQIKIFRERVKYQKYMLLIFQIKLKTSKRLKCQQFLFEQDDWIDKVKTVEFIDQLLKSNDVNFVILKLLINQVGEVSKFNLSQHFFELNFSIKTEQTPNQRLQAITKPILVEVKNFQNSYFLEVVEEEAYDSEDIDSDFSEGLRMFVPSISVKSPGEFFNHKRCHSLNKNSTQQKRKFLLQNKLSKSKRSKSLLQKSQLQKAHRKRKTHKIFLLREPKIDNSPYINMYGNGCINKQSFDEEENQEVNNMEKPQLSNKNQQCNQKIDKMQKLKQEYENSIINKDIANQQQEESKFEEYLGNNKSNSKRTSNLNKTIKISKNKNLNQKLDQNQVFIDAQQQNGLEKTSKIKQNMDLSPSNVSHSPLSPVKRKIEQINEESPAKFQMLNCLKEVENDDRQAISLAPSLSLIEIKFFEENEEIKQNISLNNIKNLNKDHFQIFKKQFNEMYLPKKTKSFQEKLAELSSDEKEIFENWCK